MATLNKERALYYKPRSYLFRFPFIIIKISAVAGSQLSKNHHNALQFIQIIVKQVSTLS